MGSYDDVFLFDLLDEIKENRMIYEFDILNIEQKYIPNDKYGSRLIYHLKCYNHFPNSDSFTTIVDIICYVIKKEQYDKAEKINFCTDDCINNICINMIKNIISKELNRISKSVLLSLNSERIKNITSYKCNFSSDELKQKILNLDRYCVYVLLLENNKYYVGVTSNLKNRLYIHRSGNGALFTKMYEIKKLIGTIKCSLFVNKVGLFSDKDIPSHLDCEELVTICFISEYGMENVQGAQYTGNRSRGTYFSKFSQNSFKIDFILKLFSVIK